MDFVINPAGASGKALKQWQKIEKILEEKRIDYKAHFSTLDDSITDICKRLTSVNKDITIIVVGGDGTMNDAVNGIEDFSKVKFGMIPCGSGNDLALGLNVEKNLNKLIEIIIENKTKRQMNIGKILFHHRCDFLNSYTGKIENKETFEDYERRFNISAGIGFDAEICEAVAVSKAKKVLNKIKLGSLVYIVEAVRLIFGNKHTKVSLDYGNKIENYNDCAFVVGMNTKFEGGGFQFCPHAQYDDNLLDFLIVDGLSRTKFFMAFPSAYKGGHLMFNGVYENQSNKIHIKTEEPMWVHTDGEVMCKSKDIELSLCDQKLNLII